MRSDDTEAPGAPLPLCFSRCLTLLLYSSLTLFEHASTVACFDGSQLTSDSGTASVYPSDVTKRRDILLSALETCLTVCVLSDNYQIHLEVFLTCKVKQKKICQRLFAASVNVPKMTH